MECFTTGISNEVMICICNVICICNDVMICIGNVICICNEVTVETVFFKILNPLFPWIVYFAFYFLPLNCRAGFQ